LKNGRYIDKIYTPNTHTWSHDAVMQMLSTHK